MDDVSKAEAGENFAFAVKQDGTLWAWGANDRGQLGDGTAIDRLSPVKVADGIADTNLTLSSVLSAISSEPL